MTNSNILITGATGFLGKYVLKAFSNTEDCIHTIGRSNNQGNVNESHIYWGVITEVPKLKNILYKKVVHIAGKAHVVPKTEEEKKAFFDVNLEGTKCLLSSLEKNTNRPEQFIFISTIAVYGLSEGSNISEKKTPNPSTPYGESKLLAEQKVIEWCNKNNCKFLILRLPLIVGTDPPGNLGSMKKAIQKGIYPRIKNNFAKKSAVLAGDVAELITKEIVVSGIYNLTDKMHPSFSEIEDAFEKRVNTKIRIAIPISILQFLARLSDYFSKVFKINLPISKDKIDKITSTLTFDDTKAQKKLGWKPNPIIPFIEKKI